MNQTEINDALLKVKEIIQQKSTIPPHHLYHQENLNGTLS